MAKLDKRALFNRISSNVVSTDIFAQDQVTISLRVHARNNTVGYMVSFPEGDEFGYQYATTLWEALEIAESYM